ncbi:MAG: ABC transporter permease [Deltaproteobacteria bacterium]|nr:ABC transporter permease [Deltaproteobacteria bacterium]PJB94722.1 MAG: ABC transporter permease [Nitrospirae bacterium CG_4_9_14_0_8_um_filter_70_14]
MAVPPRLARWLVAPGWAGWLLVAMAIGAAAAPWLAPHDPSAIDLAGALAPPSVHHWLGQDRLGRDLLSRLLFGARISLLVGMATVTVTATVGAAVGLLAGWLGGWVDELLMRITDCFLAFPGILLAIAFTAATGPGIGHVILALSIIGWVGYARLTRGQVLALRSTDFMAAATGLGLSLPRLLLRHLLPSVAAPLTVEATFGFAYAILAESSLSFLGLGAPPPTATWGGLLNGGRADLLVAPHVTTFPGVAIFLTVVAAVHLGDRLRDHLDPRHEALAPHP